MKVGDYVRTIKGSIYKLKEEDLMFEMTRQNCKISSPNIIDLIEVGDYVNGMKVGEKPPMINPNTYEEYIKGKIFLDDEIYTDFVEYWWDRPYIKIEDIKSIVTKEQFKSMEYKIGE